MDLESGVEVDYSAPGWTTLEFVTWAADGIGVFVDALAESGPRLNNKALLYVDTEGHGNIHVVRNLVNEWHYAPTVSPDGRYLAFALRKLESNVWMLKGF